MPSCASCEVTQTHTHTQRRQKYRGAVHIATSVELEIEFQLSELIIFGIKNERLALVVVCAVCRSVGRVVPIFPKLAGALQCAS